MKIGGVQPGRVSFKRNLTPAESEEYTQVLKEARKVANNDGKSILIVPDFCLPQNAASDTGIGHLTSKTSGDFFDFARNVLGINTIEVLPQGEIQVKHTPGFYNTYNGSALSLGTQEIDLELLTEPKFHSILPKGEFEKVVQANRATQEAGLVNFENIVGAGSPQEKALRIAFDNFINNPDIDRTAFEQFKAANNDWLDPKSIYAVLKEENGGKKWTQWGSEIDRTLFDSVTPERTARIEDLRRTHASDIEFYKFKQFLADEHLKMGREALHKKGMKLFGDCLIGFADDETWAFKSAFLPDTNVGLKEWKIPALDFANIKDRNSAAQRLLRRKVELYAQRYDGIRMDASWSYVRPMLSNGSKYDFRGALLEVIEETVKSVKGENYNPSDIIHEFEANPKDFSIFGPDGKILPFLRSRVKVVSSAYMDDKYGSVDAMMRIGGTPSEFVFGVGNHDPQPLRQLEENIPEVIDGISDYRRPKQERLLQNIFNMDSSEMAKPGSFTKAKFAEPLTGENQMVFFMDIFGRKERFDAQTGNSRINYRYRISPDFVQEHGRAVQEGFGLNIMDAYERAFRKRGLDKSNRNLYDRIVQFRDIILERVTEESKNAADAVDSTIQKVSNTKKFGWKGMGLAAAAICLISGVLYLTNKGLKNLDKQPPKINKNA